MIRGLLYFVMLFMALAFMRCSDVAVGFLFTDDASYAQDTLYITRFSNLDEADIDVSIPWVTSQIEQLLGTEPLSYSLVGVKSPNGQEAAEDFAKYLTVIGGGRMYVDARVDSPEGCYTVSLKVENEGHSAILTDIFTFVLE